jgi:nucleotide-binding universal stress UspA family protein
MFTRILVASDGSECALKAAHDAVMMASKFDVPLTALYVFSVPATVATFGGAQMGTVDPQVIEDWAEEMTQAVAERTGRVLEDAGVPCAFRAERGYPAEEIVRVAEEEGCDLIILGSRGHGTLRSRLLGSTSDWVLHHARCSVLIVK